MVEPIVKLENQIERVDKAVKDALANLEAAIEHVDRARSAYKKVMENVQV